METHYGRLGFSFSNRHRKLLGGEKQMRIGEHEVTVLSRNKVKVGCQEVSREQITNIQILMAAWEPPKSKFELGDFVRVLAVDIENYSSEKRVGLSGKVVAIGWKCGKPDDIGVEFACTVYNGHDLQEHIQGQRTKHGHGRWFRPEQLEKID